jgi:predicted Ser/Thr protein kinase
MPPIPEAIGRYDIIELVGRGGMGVLYRARDKTLQRDVALKMMLVDFTHDPSARDRFEREARAVARLQHRNVVTIHELGEADGAPFIVMEFLGGKDLDAILKAGTQLTLAEKLDIGVQLCEGLSYAHEQGIVHRDIKPGNVRVLEDGTVKILDFGIAKFAMSSVTQSGTIMGTPSYMAPEQVMGAPVDGRADLFSVGVLLYELLIGKKPFAGEAPTAVVYQIMHVEPPPLRTIDPELPEAVEEIVSHALRKNPDERYARASEMASDLQMVKMMLDLPLRSGKTGPVELGDGEAPTLRLHATSIVGRTATTPASPATVLINTPMRANAMAAAADAAPRADEEKDKTRGRGFIFGIAALAAVIVVIVGIFAIRGARTNTTDTAQAAPANASGAASGAAPPAGAKQLLVSSVPSGARITVNGVDTQQVTPANVSFDSASGGTLELALKGYEPIAATLTAADFDAGKREFKFSRALVPVRLSVSSAYPVELVQGGRVVSAAAKRHDMTVQPGGGPIRVRSAEYLLDSAIAVDFQRAQVEYTLPAPGTLSVFASAETCSVSVDGQDLGPVPIPRKAIAAGAHTVALKCPDGKNDSQKVTVMSGETLRVAFTGKS